MKPRRRPEIAWRVIDGEAVVVNPRTGLVYPFNPVAARFWELADGARTLDQIVAAVCEEFDAPQPQVSDDLNTFVEMLLDKGLLEPMEIAAVSTEGS